MGFLAPKAPPMPAAPPPPPTAPIYPGQRIGPPNLRGALGGTFLTAGQKLGMSNVGKSFLGA